MEWTGNQQIWFFLQSVLLGCVQGVLLDILTGFARVSHRKKWLWTDVVFGPMAAVITFLGALVIMDGQLHPLLLFGVFSGMAIEHLLVGGWLSRCITQACRITRKGFRIIKARVTETILVATARLRKACHSGENRVKIGKNSKNCHGFFKKPLEFFNNTQ